ncbi:endonuclease/exonuclease/phosphatase family protein [Mucilaginibacter sp. CSA2-8R]|uniref:endonuclease/exonuclease/phosphatase family protein n=1 Tax=Mucilaginibacter sp. CSA2-8R TaxID=3141542 RepID=UPI00315D9AFE
MPIKKRNSKLIITIDKVARVINFIFALLLLLSILAGFISPQICWPLALAGLCYSIFLLGNLFFVIYWIARANRFVLVSLACILIGWKPLINTIGFHLRQPADLHKSPGNIRIMTFNVHDFNTELPNRDSSQHAMLQLLKSKQPDVVCFQEYYSWRSDNPYQITDSIKKALGVSYHYFKPFAGTTTYDIGLAIFSRFPIVDTGLISAQQADKELDPGIFCDIRRGKQTFRVYDLHLRSVSFDAVDYEYINQVAAHKQIRLQPTLHIISKLKSAFTDRSDQVKLLRHHVLTYNNPFIFAGDFNDTPTSYVFTQLSSGLKSAFASRGSGFGVTYESYLPDLQLDHILLSPTIKVKYFKIFKETISDHYPVIADLSLEQ